jgi:hypothetical protein
MLEKEGLTGHHKNGGFYCERLTATGEFSGKSHRTELMLKKSHDLLSSMLRLCLTGYKQLWWQ